MITPALIWKDHFLADDQHERIMLCLRQQWGALEQESSWFGAQGLQASLLPLPVLTPVLDLLEKVLCLFRSEFQQPSPSAGLEWWINRNTSHAWHLDKDETLLQASRKLRPADRSFLYYVQQPSFGGELELMPAPLMPPDGYRGPTRSVEPLQGRLVSFDSRTYHRVKPYQGSRLSIAMNAWLQPPLLFSDQTGFLL